MSKRHKYKICTIGGDGIGPEVIKETVRLLEATCANFEFNQGWAGFDTYQRYKTPLPDETIKLCKRSDAVLFGAVITPSHIKNYFSPIVKLRRQLALYANIRPCFSLPLADQKRDIDLVIIRENLEGLYSGRERKTEAGAITERVITSKGSEQIIHSAFEFARNKARKYRDWYEL